MCRNVLCTSYVIAHWDELDSTDCVENKGWTCYASCTLKDLRGGGGTLNLTHPLLYWQQMTWAPVTTMKNGQMIAKIRSISSGSWCCHWISGFNAFSMTLDYDVTTFLWNIKKYTPNDSIILEDLYGGTVGLFGETTMYHIYIIFIHVLSRTVVCCG